MVEKKKFEWKKLNWKGGEKESFDGGWCEAMYSKKKDESMRDGKRKTARWGKGDFWDNVISSIAGGAIRL